MTTRRSYGAAFLGDDDDDKRATVARLDGSSTMMMDVGEHSTVALMQTLDVRALADAPPAELPCVLGINELLALIVEHAHDIGTLFALAKTCRALRTRIYQLLPMFGQSAWFQRDLIHVLHCMARTKELEHLCYWERGTAVRLALLVRRHASTRHAIRTEGHAHLVVHNDFVTPLALTVLWTRVLRDAVRLVAAMPLNERSDGVMSFHSLSDASLLHYGQLNFPSYVKELIWCGNYNNNYRSLGVDVCNCEDLLCTIGDLFAVVDSVFDDNEAGNNTEFTEMRLDIMRTLCSSSMIIQAMTMDPSPATRSLVKGLYRHERDTQLARQQQPLASHTGCAARAFLVAFSDEYGHSPFARHYSDCACDAKQMEDGFNLTSKLLIRMYCEAGRIVAADSMYFSDDKSVYRTPEFTRSDTPEQVAAHLIAALFNVHPILWPPQHPQIHFNWMIHSACCNMMHAVGTELVRYNAPSGAFTSAPTPRQRSPMTRVGGNTGTIQYVKTLDAHASTLLRAVMARVAMFCEQCPSTSLSGRAFVKNIDATRSMLVAGLAMLDNNACSRLVESAQSWTFDARQPRAIAQSIVVRAMQVPSTVRGLNARNGAHAVEHCTQAAHDLWLLIVALEDSTRKPLTTAKLRGEQPLCVDLSRSVNAERDRCIVAMYLLAVLCYAPPLVIIAALRLLVQRVANRQLDSRTLTKVLAYFDFIDDEQANQCLALAWPLVHNVPHISSSSGTDVVCLCGGTCRQGLVLASLMQGQRFTASIRHATSLDPALVFLLTRLPFMRSYRFTQEEDVKSSNNAAIDAITAAIAAAAKPTANRSTGRTVWGAVFRHEHTNNDIYWTLARDVREPWICNLERGESATIWWSASSGCGGPRQRLVDLQLSQVHATRDTHLAFIELDLSAGDMASLFELPPTLVAALE